MVQMIRVYPFILILMVLLFSSQLFSVVIDGFKVEGSVTISDEEIASMTGLKPGEEVYQLDLQIAARKLYSSGYFSSVDLDVVQEGTANLLLVKISENPAVEDFAVEINGPGLVSKDSIMASITIEKGKALSLTRLQESLANIKKVYQEAGYFLIELKVNVSLSPTGVVSVPNGKVVITINEYSIWDVVFEPQLPKEEVDYLRSRIAVPLYKNYATKPSIIRFFLTKKDYYPTISQFQQTQSNLARVSYVGPETNLSFEPFEDALNTLIMKIKISPPKVVEKPVHIENVEISGNESLSSEELKSAAREALQSFGGEELSNLELGIAVDRIRRLYERKGIVFVSFKPEVEDGMLKVNVEEKKLTKVTIEGLTKTKPYLIEDYLSLLNKGEVVKMSDLAAVYRGLNATGYFESVDLLPREYDSGLELLVRFTETNKPRKFGGGITWTDPKEGEGFWDRFWKGLSGYLDFQIVNALGYGESLGTVLELGTTKRNVKINGSLPRVGGSYFGLESDLYYRETTESTNVSSEDPEASETSVATVTHVWGVEPSLSYRLNSKDSVGLTLTVERGEESSSSTTKSISSTKIGLFFQHRDIDDLWYPMNGNWLNLRYTLSGVLPSDTQGYQKMFADVRGYWQVVPSLSFAIRGQLGSMWDVKGSPDLFSLGGSTTIRGVSSVIEGARMWLVNAELRWRLLDPEQTVQLYAVAFFDMGYAGEEFEGSPVTSQGVGFHLKVPGIGVFRLDLPYLDGQWKTSFGFGAMF